METNPTAKEVLISIIICACIGLVMYNANRLVSLLTSPDVSRHLGLNPAVENNQDPYIAFNPLTYPKDYSPDLAFDMGPLLASSEVAEGGKKHMTLNFRSLNSYDLDVSTYKIMLDYNKWTIVSTDQSATSTQIKAKKGKEGAIIRLQPMEGYPNLTIVNIDYTK